MIELLKLLIRKMIHTLLLPRNIVFCKLCGVRWGEGWDFKGLPIIRRKKCSKIVIGKRFYAVSLSKFNTIGVSQPVILTSNGKGSKIVIGDDVGMSGCTISALNSIEIGDGCLIGSGTLITDNDAHPIYSLHRRYSHENIMSEPIKIGKNVFVGAKAIILKGVILGDNCVVGAGSVVTGSFPDNAVIAGNPAKIIRQIEFFKH